MWARSFAAVFFLFLAQIVRSMPTGEIVNDLTRFSSSKSLYDLIQARDPKKRSAAAKEQFQSAFSRHPEIQKVDLHNSDREKTIKHLFEIKKQALASSGRGKDPEHARRWGQKFTTATYHLLSDPQLHPELLKDYKIYNEHVRNQAYTERKLKRYHSVEENGKMRAKQRAYDAALKQKRVMQREQGSVMDQPLVRHIGVAAAAGASNGHDRRTVAQIIEQGDELRHLYTTGPKLRLALEDYLIHSGYDQKEVTRALLQRSRNHTLARVRSRNNDRNRKEQSKKRRLGEHLASSNWYKTSNL